ILSILDSSGKELARADAPRPDVGDPLLAFAAPADGIYTERVRDRFSTRGGAAYAYRLRFAHAAQPDFQLRIPTTALNIPRGGQAQLQVALQRHGGFQEP